MRDVLSGRYDDGRRTFPLLVGTEEPPNRHQFVVRAKERLKQRLQDIFLGASGVIVLN